MIKREIEKVLQELATQYPIITVTGPRQSGKTTLVKGVFSKKPYVNLENLSVRALAFSDPVGLLKKYPEGAILDEIQRAPELLSYIQEIVDENDQKGHFILSGSHQLELHQAITQSLAGRNVLLTLLPLSLSELAAADINLELDQYLYQGFFPRIYKDKLNPTTTYQSYVRTYIERDVRQLINIKDLHTFQQFIQICASRVGQILNVHSLSNDLGMSNHTIKSWLSILEASYLIVLLQPYYENFGKRIIKSPKLYFTDIGLVTYLLNIENLSQLERDPLRGHLIENLVVIELFKARYNKGREPNFYFFRDNNNNEVDLIFKLGNQLIPIEIKSGKTFHADFLKGLKYFKSLVDNRCDKGFLIYTGKEEQRIEDFYLINYKNGSVIIND